jgi:hypothetical protein
MKYRHFFSLLTLGLLANTVASAHNTVLTLRQDDATNTISVYRENVARNRSSRRMRGRIFGLTFIRLWHRMARAC